MNSPMAPTTLEAAAAEVDRLTSELTEQFEELAYNQNAVIRLKAELERLQDAKRRALAIADERGKENAALRAVLNEIVTLWND
jgi:hypothetical protein